MWTIIFWIFAVIGMIITLFGIVILIGSIFSSSECNTTSSGKDWMKEYDNMYCHYGSF